MFDSLITAAVLILIVIKILDYFDVFDLVGTLVRLLAAAVTLTATLLAYLFDRLKRSLQRGSQP